MKALLVTLLTITSVICCAQIQKANFPVGDLKTSGINLKTTELKDFFPNYPEGFNAEILEEQFLPNDPCPALVAPTGIAGLTSGWTLETYQLSISAAASVGIISAGDASVSQGKEIHVYDFMYIKKENDCGNNTVTWGAGVRLVITVKKLDASLSLSGLAAFAAAAELHKSEVSIKMEVIGMSGEKLASAVPSAGPYDVVRHSEFMAAVDKIKLLAYDSTTTVTPQKISIEIIDNYFFTRALLYNHAMVNISNKKNYTFALSKLKTPSPENVEILKTAYVTLIGRADGTPVTDLEALTVRERLKKGDIVD